MDTSTQTGLESKPVQRFAAGCGIRSGETDRAAQLAAFARCHHQSLVRFFTRRLGSREEARDLVQCAYVKVLAVDRLERIRDIEGYVWRSALNLATDWSRHRTVRDGYVRCAASDLVVPAHPIEMELETRERIDLVARVHETLSPKCQEAFTLRMLEDRPFKDVGRVMGISDRMAKIYVTRARASIQDAIARAE